MTAPSQHLAGQLLAALRSAAVRHVVLCPGSRSAPLAYQLAAAERAGLVQVFVRHDERVAGFTALGMGRAGHPAAVITTSGTAVANLHPAVLEAHHSGVPLIVVSADRPAALSGTWANQTSELQPALFGAALRAHLDQAASHPGELLGALRKALGGNGSRPGPVHLNLRFAEPLLPDGDLTAPDDAETIAVTDRPAIVAAAPAVASQPIAEAAQRVAVPLRLVRGPRTVVIAGDGAGPAARTLAERAGWPLLAEPSSGSRGGPRLVPAYRLLIGRPGFGDRVQRVIAFGRPTLSRPVTALLNRPDVELVLVSPFDDWPQPGRDVVRAKAVDLDQPATERGGDAAWTATWAEAGLRAERALHDLLAAQPRPNGLTLARSVAATLPPGADLLVAASNPIRDLDLVAGELPGAVIANRGLSGIDGTLSTAMGHALASGRPIRVLAGDLAVLHDLGALLATPGEHRPDVQVVVLNDGGGGIFSLLEYGAWAEADQLAAAEFERYFGTPQQADLAALCQGYGVPHRQLRTVAEVDAELGQPISGVSVIEVPADRAALRHTHAAIAAAVAAATASQPAAPHPAAPHPAAPHPAAPHPGATGLGR